MIDMVASTAGQIDDYLTDQEIQPKPITKLVSTLPSYLYLEQMIECAPYWMPDARLVVGSILLGQPLKAQGAVDVHFIYADRADADHDNPDGPPRLYIPLGSVGATQDGFICIEILGDWNANVNRPAMKAQGRMAERGLKLDEQWPHLYQFVREVASNGFGDINLNVMASNGSIDKNALSFLRSAEHELVRRAVSALNKFEGQDYKLSSSDRREQAQHQAWDDE